MTRLLALRWWGCLGVLAALGCGGSSGAGDAFVELDSGSGSGTAVDAAGRDAGSGTDGALASDGGLDAALDGSFDAMTADVVTIDALVDGAGDAASDAEVVDAGDAAVAPLQPGPDVRVAEGVLRGKVEGSSHVFLGVPFAAPPVGALRFAPPQAPLGWQGTRGAQTFGAACPQPHETGKTYGLPAVPQSEDCLFLNVVAPADVAAGEKLPVMVWIHGGSGLHGTGAEYDGRGLSERGRVVVVTLNYRLGALSSLALPALDTALGVRSGNLALRDQQRALRWLHDNIAAFGGDSAQVTLFGESQGSISTCHHLFISGNDGLVQHFIMESGGCLGSAVSPASRAQMEAVSQDVVAALCAGKSDVVGCLRGLSTAQLVGFTNTHSNVMEQIGGYHVDGQLLSAHPAKLVREGKFQKGPILLGLNQHETRFLASPAYGTMWPLVDTGLSFLIGVTAMYPDYFGALFDHYGLPANEQANDTLVKLMDDGWFRCPARVLSREVAAKGVDVFLYSFELSPAVHTQEIDYVFGFKDARVSKVFEGAPVPPHAGLMDAVQSYWLAFAKTGNPNGQGRAEWPKFTTDSQRHIVLNATLSTGVNLGADDCDMWDQALVVPNR